VRSKKLLGRRPPDTDLVRQENSSKPQAMGVSGVAVLHFRRPPIGVPGRRRKPSVLRQSDGAGPASYGGIDAAEAPVCRSLHGFQGPTTRSGLKEIETAKLCRGLRQEANGRRAPRSARVKHFAPRPPTLSRPLQHRGLLTPTQRKKTTRFADKPAIGSLPQERESNPFFPVCRVGSRSFRRNLG